MVHIYVQSQSLQVSLDLVQLELKIELERLERIKIFLMAILIDKAWYIPPGADRWAKAV